MKLPRDIASFIKRYRTAGRFAVRVVLGNLHGGGIVAEAVDKVLEVAVETGKDNWEADQADSETTRRALEALDSLGEDMRTLLAQVAVLEGLPERAEELVRRPREIDEQSRRSFNLLCQVLEGTRAVGQGMAELRRAMLPVEFPVPGEPRCRSPHACSADWNLKEKTPITIRLEPHEVYLLRADRSAADADIAKLGRLEGVLGLKHLDLSGCGRLTDAGLAAVARLSQVESLDLRWCEGVTDAGVGLLAVLPSLRELYFVGCRGVSNDAVLRLRAAWPDRRVSY